MPDLTGYTCVLTPDPAGGYSAEVLECPGCVAQGETADAALTALHRAADAWLAAAAAQGQPIPAPLSTHAYHGRVLLRLPRSLHRDLARRAAREGVSLNTWCVTVLAQAWGREP